MALGRKICIDQCVGCHEDDGYGTRRAPTLAGNGAVIMTEPLNAANMIRHQGGFAVATRDNPRPHGMPPSYRLGDRELAGLLTTSRVSWGNDAPPVSTTCAVIRRERRRTRRAAPPAGSLARQRG